MAIFDGKELTFEESDWFIVNFFRMLWRYGFNFLRMQMWVESILDKFMRWGGEEQLSWLLNLIPLAQDPQITAPPLLGV